MEGEGAQGPVEEEANSSVTRGHVGTGGAGGGHLSVRSREWGEAVMV